jgi:hypothetical protein
MNDAFSVTVYKKRDELDDAWYLNEEINAIVCCLLGIPGIQDRISFSDHVVKTVSGMVNRSLHFTVTFRGPEGQIGSEFLYSCLEDSVNWVISENNSTSLSFDSEIYFEQNITLVGSNRNFPVTDIIGCFNKEIQKPRWEKYWDKFSLKFSGEFIDI